MMSPLATSDESQDAKTPADPGRMCRRIVLTGFMGAGKTTVGKALAAQLGWTFLDLDGHIEQRAGRSVRDIFAEQGEARFRRLESSALANALRNERMVLALGGGAPETLANRLLLEQTPCTFTIFLHAPFPVLFDRCMLQSIDRPNLRDSAAAAARYAARLPLYRRISQMVLETEIQEPATTACVIVQALASR